MSLFKTADLVEIKEDPVNRITFIKDGSTENIIAVKSRSDIEKILSHLNTGNGLIHYCTGGAFSAHELLFCILAMTGPVKVYITTWTMTEYPARLLSEALQSGKIIELFCLLDIRMEKNANVFQLIRNNSTKIRLSHCHAKTIIVQNDAWIISVISSQNITENPRIKAGVICSNPIVADFHKQWILKEIENGNAFE